MNEHLDLMVGTAKSFSNRDTDFRVQLHQTLKSLSEKLGSY